MNVYTMCILHLLILLLFSSGPVETSNVTFGSVRDGSSEDVRNITTGWETDEDYPNQTSGYVLTLHPVDPPTPGIKKIRPGRSEFTEKRVELRVSLGVLYNVSVRTDNCGDRQEGNTVTKSLLLNGMLGVYVDIVPVPVYVYIHVHSHVGCVELVPLGV